MTEKDDDRNRKNGQKTEDERDAFWNLRTLVPPRRRSSPAPAAHTDPVEIEIGLPQNGGNGGDADDLADAIGTARAVQEKLPEITAAARTARENAKAAREAAAAAAIPPRPAGPDGRPAARPPRAGSSAVPIREYEPENSLIKKVSVCDWSSGYAYYETFRTTAMRVARMQAPASEPPRVSFFSYVPQYSQMTDRNLAYYLWVRGEIRAGRFPEADYSYILLYIYELLNLSDLTPPEETLGHLCDIWRGYHVEHEHLNVNLIEWICDFCLIYGFPPPIGRLGSPAPTVFRAASLKEFFISAAEGDLLPRLVMAYCTNYDYRSGKYAAGENAALYDRCMNGAMRAVFSQGEEIWKNPSLQSCRTVRDPYVGALCSPKVKKRLEIEYFSFAHSHELRFLVTDVIKYTDNKVRALIGVKSRLKTGPLPDRVRAAVDGFFKAEFPSSRTSKNDVPAYEKLYEPQGSGLTADSIANAGRIESASWETTEKLVEAFDGPVGEAENEPSACAAPDAVPFAEPPAAPAVPAPADAPDDPEEAEEADRADRPPLDEAELRFLTACLTADRAAEAGAAAGAGKLPAALADAINEKCADFFGDIVLEETPDGSAFAVIADYEDDVKSWL